MQRRAAVDLDAGDGHRGARVVGGARYIDVDRLVLLAAAARHLAEDRGALPIVDRLQFAREVVVEREPVVPDELELVDLGVVEGGGEAREAGLVEHLGEPPLGLVRVHRCRSGIHVPDRCRAGEVRPPRTPVSAMSDSAPRESMVAAPLSSRVSGATRSETKPPAFLAEHVQVPLMAMVPLAASGDGVDLVNTDFGGRTALKEGAGGDADFA